MYHTILRGWLGLPLFPKNPEGRTVFILSPSKKKIETIEKWAEHQSKPSLQERGCHQHWLGDIGKGKGTNVNVTNHLIHMGITRPVYKVLRRKDRSYPGRGKGVTI